MKIKTFALIVASLIATTASAQEFGPTFNGAQNYGFGPGSDMCSYSAQYMTGPKCGSRKIPNAHKRKQHWDNVVAPYLKHENYPDEIRVTDPAIYAIVKRPWKKSGNCAKLGKTETGVFEIDKAKILYCVGRQNDIRIPLPKIIKAF